MPKQPDLSQTDLSLSSQFVPSLSYWQLVRIRFRRHRLAVASLYVLLTLYIVCVLFAEFFAPYKLATYSEANIASPPQVPRFIDETGQFHLRPFVYGWESEVDQATGERIFTIDTSQRFPLHFIAHGEPYKLWGMMKTDWHIFVADGGYAYILGGDRLGRDLLSRIIYGGRVSLTVGSAGIAISLILGVIIGTISGYFGGSMDTVIQRIIEIMLSFPGIPLWLTLSAALPPNWSSIQVYFAITTLLGFLFWTRIARQIRGQALMLREQTFVKASRALGASHARIIFCHLIPNLANYMIVITTLTIPGIILSETGLSFLGLGIRPPMTSWGVLLEEAQNVQAIVRFPWFTIPAFFVILTVLAYNFLGDGIRDATAPRAHSFVEKSEH